MADIPNPKPRFVTPQELGLDTPINTKEELCQIARAINASYDRQQKAAEQRQFNLLKQKYGLK